MTTAKQLPAEDAAVLGLCAHGQTGEVGKSNYRPEWAIDPVGKLAIEAAISLERTGNEVNAIAVIARGKLPAEYHADVLRIFKNGYGAASVADSVEHAYATYMVGRARALAAEMERLATARPREVRRWMPALATQLSALLHQGESYDPSPEAHMNKPLPKIFTRSLITGMTDMLRGGYRRGELLVYAGVTGQGKTTTLNSHAIDLLLQGYRVTIIRTENTEQAATAEICSALAGIDLFSEVQPDVFRDTEYETSAQREERYRETVRWCTGRLDIYKAEYFTQANLENIAAWYKPNALIIDNLKAEVNFFTERRRVDDLVGEIADWLLVYGLDNGIWVGAGGQVSGTNTKAMLVRHWSERVQLYGSAKVEQASGEFILARRHPDLARHAAEFRVQKDRHLALIDTAHIIPLDVPRRILEIPKLLTDGIPDLES